MERLERAALILSLIDKMRERGSWCGETHIQKASYFLQEVLSIPLGFQFVLYKHGPFSFELRDELTGMRADEILAIMTKPFPYGPSLIPGENIAFLKNYGSIIRQYESKIASVADQLAAMGVAQLEKVSTALFVTRKIGQDKSLNSRAQYLHKLKPHVSIEDAAEAICEVDQWLAGTAV